MSSPTSVVFIVRKDHGVILVKNEKDGLWTLPAQSWDGADQSVVTIANSFFYPYFEEIDLGKLHHLASPHEKILLDGECVMCSVFEIVMKKGKLREEKKREVWIAAKSSLVPQVITPDIRCIIGLSEVQGCL